MTILPAEGRGETPRALFQLSTLEIGKRRRRAGRGRPARRKPVERLLAARLALRPEGHAEQRRTGIAGRRPAHRRPSDW
ncbi:hypothetical protein HD597_005668 [Nonomuraea thailandensis]|uniref:Uncharacterized protein n=1 Tax=Nonomuraea thailandensis TaxID=1188745 RepID=A0A9X2GQH6_9ACTN|nr:hypothetical protein [Nonomuraea thailandensis]MCP2358648.1 hypothetical protein [Nonomuraea thailandensis]